MEKDNGFFILMTTCNPPFDLFILILPFPQVGG